VSGIRCFLVEPTKWDRLRIARSTRSGCRKSAFGHHSKWVTTEIRLRHHKRRAVNRPPLNRVPSHRSRLWPKTCAACRYRFKPKDDWDACADLLYAPADGSLEPQTLNEMPAGAMWYADWFSAKSLPPEKRGPKGKILTPDGRVLVVKTPGGEWIVDYYSTPASGELGLGWTRTGSVRNGTVTASPSIRIGEPERYHGWLRNGYLVPA
jgi:hypothetical protein